MNFLDYVQAQGGRIDAVLDELLPAAAVRPAILHAAMRHAIFPGGKRLRPALCLAACTACQGDPDAALLPAAALELLHSYTLVHDDLPCMDDDDFRRGIPTVHKQYGEANAVLAGDALQALAFEAVARTGRADLVRELAIAAGSAGVIAGQVEDLAGHDVDAATIAFVHEHKTADLIRVSVRLGALCAGADTRRLTALNTYGHLLGMAFQLSDDLLDAPHGQPDEKGLNWLRLMTPAAARARLVEHEREALKQLSIFGPEAQPLREAATFVTHRDH